MEHPALVSVCVCVRCTIPLLNERCTPLTGHAVTHASKQDWFHCMFLLLLLLLLFWICCCCCSFQEGTLEGTLWSFNGNRRTRRTLTRTDGASCTGSYRSSDRWVWNRSNTLCTYGESCTENRTGPEKEQEERSVAGWCRSATCRLSMSAS